MRWKFRSFVFDIYILQYVTSWFSFLEAMAIYPKYIRTMHMNIFDCKVQCFFFFWMNQNLYKPNTRRIPPKGTSNSHGNGNKTTHKPYHKPQPVQRAKTRSKSQQASNKTTQRIQLQRTA